MDRELLIWIHDQLSQWPRPDEVTIKHILRSVKERLDEPVTYRISRALTVLQAECPPLAEQLIMAQSCNRDLADQRDALLKKVQ